MKKATRFLNPAWIVVSLIIVIVSALNDLNIWAIGLILTATMISYFVGMWDGTPQQTKDIIRTPFGQWDWEKMQRKPKPNKPGD